MIRSMPPVWRMAVTSTYMKATVNRPVLEKPPSAWDGSRMPSVSSRITAPSRTISGPSREKAISGKTAITTAREIQASRGMAGIRSTRVPLFCRPPIILKSSLWNFSYSINGRIDPTFLPEPAPRHAPHGPTRAHAKGPARGGPFLDSRRSHISVSWRLADDLDVGSLEAFLALGDVEGNLLAVLQGLEAVSLDLGEVSEQVVTVVVRRDEAEALGVVEPLDSTGSHYRIPRIAFDFPGNTRVAVGRTRNLSPGNRH